MSTVSLTQVAPQVKTVTLTRQNLLTQKLTHAVANRSTREAISVDGQKFTLEYHHGAGGNRNYYTIKTTKKEAVSVPVGGKKQAEFLRSLGKPVATEIQSFVKPIESGAVLEVELGISSTMANKVVPVAGWADTVEAYVAKICNELGWQYVSPRKQAFNERVAMLHGDQSYID